MEKIRILHTADLHMMENKNSATPQVLADIIKLAADEKVDALLVAGDFFDSSMATASDKSYAASLFAQIPDIQVFLAAGNHDPLPAYKNVQMPENVHIFMDKMDKFELPNADIYGISFGGNYEPASLIEGFSVDNPHKINILVMHGDLGQITKYNPFSQRQLEETGIDYAALGHVHAHSGIHKARNTFYAYSGIPQGRGFDELGEKGVIIGDVCKGYIDLKFVKTSRVEFHEVKVDISECKDYSEIHDAVQTAAPETKDAYKIKLIGSFAGDFEINPDLVTNMLGDYFQVKVINATTVQIDLNELAGEFSLRGLFVKKALAMELSEAAINYGLTALDGKKVELW